MNVIDMDRIVQLHGYFKKVNSKFKDDRLEDSVLEEEEARELERQKLMSNQGADASKVILNGQPVNNGHTNGKGLISKDQQDEDDNDDDDDEDDEDFDVNKKEDGEDEEDDEDFDANKKVDNEDDDSDVSDVDSVNFDEPDSEPKSNLVQIDPTQVKELWEELQKEVTEREHQKKLQAESDSKPEVVKTRVKRYEFAGETITVQESYSFREKELLKSFEKIERAQKNSLKHPGRLEPPKRKIDLPDVLNQLKRSKLSTLSKTKHDWDEYKKDKQIVEELEQHQKSKHSYVDKQAFLQRTDQRQYQKEKKIREHQRKIRMQKQYENVEIA